MRYTLATATVLFAALAAPAFALPQSAPPRSAPQGSPLGSPQGAPAQAPGSARELEEHKRKLAEQAAACPVKAAPAQQSLGIVAPHTTVSATATLTNTLTVPVKCVMSKPTCTCTTVDMVGKTIPAGGSIQMPISMKVSGNTGMKSAAVNMLFETDAGQRVPGVVQVEISAQVAYAVFGTQANRRATGVSNDTFIDAFDFPAQVKGMVTVASADGKPFRVLSVMGQPPVFAQTSGGGTNAPGAAGPSHQLLYDFSALACADMPKWLLIETDRPEAPLIDMRVRHKCTWSAPAFGFAQYYENLGVMPIGTPREFVIEIKHANGVAVSTVKSGDPRVAVQLVGSTMEGDSLMLKLQATPQPGAEGVILAPITLSGMGTDPKNPTPMGMPPVGVEPRSSEYYLFFKGVPARSAAAQSGATAPTATP